MTLIILIAVFVGVAALTGCVAVLTTSSRGKTAEQRLDALAQGSPSSLSLTAGNAASVLTSPLEETGQRRQLEQFVSYISRFVDLRVLVQQAGVTQGPAKLVLIAVGSAVAVAAMCTLVSVPMTISPLLVITAGAIPFVWLLVKRYQRLSRFESQLPEALDLLARSLRAGHSLADGIRLIAEEMTDPISGEFRRCYEEQNLGLPLEEALDDMTRRVPNLDLRFFATATVLQRQTGGDMAEVLEKIGRLVRERFQIRAQVKALTGEGRMSGIVLLALPILLTLYMYIRDPEYLRPLLVDPLGQKMVAGAVVLQILGALIIKKIVNIKV